VTGRRILTGRLEGFGASVFAEMTALAVRTGAVNLGQGFPDYDGPAEVLETAREQIAAGANQYPPGTGTADLRSAVSEHQQRFWGLTYDPDSEVLVTMGATEAIAAALLSMVENGDEVVVFEPLFDTYAACVSLAGGVLSPVTLRPDADGRFTFDPGELRRAVTPRTKIILLNSPHNPTGTVFTREELAQVAALAVEHDLIVVSDEVYEHLTFDGAVHVPVATLPGMRERTVTVSSGGKSFNTTGWKIGWACAPAPLVNAVRMAKQLFTFAGGTPFQAAIARGLRLPDSYFTALADDLRAKRDLLDSALRGAGLVTHRVEGTYFLTADVRPLRPDGDGTAFCREMPGMCGVVAIPAGVLYTPSGEPSGRHLVRFAFCKQTTTIEEASARLASLGSGARSETATGR
jgi:N-succinyldiaminopimelate aminotransferase